jgi:hypothetical protein
MQFKVTFRKVTELCIFLAALTTLLLAGCGGGGGGGGGGGEVVAAIAKTTATITPFKGPFAPGAIVKITDANGNPVTLITGGAVNSSGVVSVSYNQNVVYPLLVSVTGSYYNEITGQYEITNQPLRSLITNASAVSNVPVSIVTETAVAYLTNQLNGPLSSSNPIRAASAVAALNVAGNIYGIPATSVPSFDFTTNKTSDQNTLQLAALAVVANSQAGTNLAAKVIALANSLATLNAASAPSDVITQTAMDAAMTIVTSGASSVAAPGTVPPNSPIIKSTSSLSTLTKVADTTNQLVGSWWVTTPQNHNVIFTFFTNGTYVQTEDGATDLLGQSGMERGSYTWDSLTGALVTTCPPIDTNGQWGFSHQTAGVCSGTTATITVSGDVLTYINGVQTMSLARVIDVTNPLVGSWTYTNHAGHYVVFTVVQTGEYVETEDGLSNTYGQTGIERGTYIYSSGGGFVSSCPFVDTNGQWGLSNQAPGTCGSSFGGGAIGIVNNTNTGANTGNSTLTIDETVSADVIAVQASLTPLILCGFPFQVALSKVNGGNGYGAVTTSGSTLSPTTFYAAEGSEICGGSKAGSYFDWTGVISYQTTTTDKFQSWSDLTIVVDPTQGGAVHDVVLRYHTSHEVGPYATGADNTVDRTSIDAQWSLTTLGINNISGVSVDYINKRVVFNNVALPGASSLSSSTTNTYSGPIYDSLGQIRIPGQFFNWTQSTPNTKGTTVRVNGVLSLP